MSRSLARYGRLVAVQLRASTLLGMQYRADFLLEGAVEVFWMATAVTPLLVVYGVRSSVAGWRFGEALMVMGWFTFLEGILEGSISPSLTSVVEHIRKGTLDFILLKPADAQFLVSTARIQPWRALNVLTAFLLFGWGFHELGRTPNLAAIAMAGVAMIAAVVVLYSLWLLAVSASFYVVRIDNLSHLFNAVFDAARWPIDIFHGALRFAFTFVLPLALMTTVPSQALLGVLPARSLAAAIAGAAIAFALSRAVWKTAIERYTSAGG